MKRLFLELIFIYYGLEAAVLRLFATKARGRALILSTDNIGDFLLRLPALERLRKAYPEGLTLACAPAVEPLARAAGLFDEVVTLFDRRMVANPIYRFKILWRITRKRYDIAVNPLYARDFFVCDSIIRVVRAKEKIGFGQNYSNTKAKFRKYIADSETKNRLSERLLGKANRFYSRVLTAESAPMHELRRNAEFVSKFLGEHFPVRLSSWLYPLPESPVQGDYIALCIGASTNEKSIGAKAFARIFDALGYRAVLLGGAGDMAEAEKILQSVKDRSRLINLVGKTSLFELFAAIGGARLAICNDSAAAHVAPMMKTPSIVALGGNFPLRFHPYSTDAPTEDEKACFPVVVSQKVGCEDCGGSCTNKDVATGRWMCIAKISVEEIISKAENLLR